MFSVCITLQKINVSQLYKRNICTYVEGKWTSEYGFCADRGYCEYLYKVSFIYNLWKVKTSSI